MIGLYGMGGVGKTTLAKVVGEEAKEKKLFDEVVMVTVTQNPDVKNMQTHIADLLGLKFEEETIEVRAQRLCLRLNKEKTILIILDDVWEKLDLTIIGIPFGDDHKGCTILLTTRQQQVCISMRLSDISSIKKLAQLEILSLKGAKIFELPKELGELSKLRILDTTKCYNLERVPANIIPRLSRLEELYIGKYIFKAWEVEGTSAEGSNASLSELSKLYRLSILSLSINVQRLPKDFVLPPTNYSEYLEMMEIKGSCQNMVPSIDETGLNELKRLSLNFDELECIIDTTQQQDVASTAFSNLVDLSLRSCVCPREICSGGRPPRGFLENLETLYIGNCGNMSSLFPSWVLIQRLRKLKKVTVDQCCELEDVFQLEGLFYAKENPFLLSTLESLDLACLRNLRYIWKGPTQQVSLQSLTVVEVFRCDKLSLARSLLQLEQLTVWGCCSLEHIVEIKEAEENVGVGGGNDVMFPKLRKLQLGHNSLSKYFGLENFINFYSGNNYSTWPALHELILYLPLSSTMSFVAQLQDFVLPTKLLRYDIRVDDDDDDDDEGASYPKSRLLKIRGIEATSLVAFKALYENVEYLELVGIKGCCQNMVPSIDETGLNELKRLSLRSFDELECIVGPSQQVSLQSLTVVKVSGCGKLRYIFTLISLARSLLQLEELTVWGCGSLEHIVEIKDAEENIAGGDGNDVIFPKLRKLQLGGLENFIYFCSQNYSSTWPALEELSLNLTLSSTPSFVAQLEQTTKEKLRVLEVGIISDQLCNMVLAQLIHGFQNLEELNIRDHRVPVLSQLELSLPSLKKLMLEELEELECLCKGPTHFLSLPNLKILRVVNCDRLRYMFSPSLARNFMQLEVLFILDCGELEQIFIEDDAEYNQTTLARNLLQLGSIDIENCKELEQFIVEDHTKDHHVQLGVLFPNLSSISVNECDKLKTLFPVTIARLGLQKLRTLNVYKSFQLEELFGHKDEADMTSDDREMVLPQLKYLTLKQLASLVNFCPVGYHFIFPSLSNLVVTECPKITTRFSVDQNRSVHAEAEVRTNIDVDVVDKR
ncbi:hypothetical protein EZV62_008196 [Acer yangbiense]|uniref:Uncharacterized protein n=1 Tax=Acer yangbiense TaxID=1000413 RepID=A0A5C7ICP4_9ROSI|nr:hypothetical protein EZV62_008196 [Acer yangbiense]